MAMRQHGGRGPILIRLLQPVRSGSKPIRFPLKTGLEASTTRAQKLLQVPLWIDAKTALAALA